MKYKHTPAWVLGTTLALLWALAPLTRSAEPAKTRSEARNGAQEPTAREVIARFVKEIGGKAAFSAITAQHVTGKFEMGGQGVIGDLEVFAKRPDKLLIKITVPAIGEILQGFDGTVAWSMNPATGPMILEGKMLHQLREQARFDAVLHDESEFKSMETLGRAQFEGRECFKLKLVHKSGQETTEFYDTETGMLIGSTETQETPLGPLAVTAVIGNYKKFGDVLFATRLTQKLGPLAQVMVFESMELNNVDDSAFTLPDQIKALVKK